MSVFFSRLEKATRIFYVPFGYVVLLVCAILIFLGKGIHFFCLKFLKLFGLTQVLPGP